MNVKPNATGVCPDSDATRLPITYSADMHRMQSPQTFAVDGNVDLPANLFTTRLEMKDGLIVIIIFILTFIRLNIKTSSNVSVQRLHCTNSYVFWYFNDRNGIGCLPSSWKTMKLKYAFDLSLLGSDPTPSGAIVSYKEVEVVGALVVLVSIFSDRLFFSSIMKRLMYVECTFSFFYWLVAKSRHFFDQ